MVVQSDMGKLTADWNDVDTVVLYGAGTIFRVCEKLFEKVEINIECVIDQDINKQGKEWNGVPILSYEDAKERINGKKIVVMAAHTAFNDISEFLEQQGLVEFKDYCRAGQFICEWFWNTKKMNCVYHIDMTVTTKCTLNCKHCNMFIPHYKERFNYSFEELKRNVDLLFERIDYVVHLGLIGGEPTINPEFPKVIEYLYKNYATQFGKITFTSNGTVIPSKETMSILKKYHVLMEISNYSIDDRYIERLEQLKRVLQDNNVEYSVRPSLIWCDFGFPEKIHKRNENQMKEHLALCRPEWNGLNDGKFYYCNVSWSAEKSGKFKLHQKDYIKLEDIDLENKEMCHTIVELSRGTSSFCKICGGCGRDNINYVKAGVQL